MVTPNPLELVSDTTFVVNVWCTFFWQELTFGNGSSLTCCIMINLVRWHNKCYFVVLYTSSINLCPTFLLKLIVKKLQSRLMGVLIIGTLVDYFVYCSYIWRLLKNAPQGMWTKHLFCLLFPFYYSIKCWKNYVILSITD